MSNEPIDPFKGEALPVPPAVADSAAERRSAMLEDLRAGSLSTLAGEAEHWLREIAEGKRPPIATPWEEVNRELGGGYRPGCHVIVGNPKAGKSAFALQFARSAAEQGAPVVYVALELDSKQLYARLLAMGDAQKDSWSSYVLGEQKTAALEALLSGDGGRLRALPFHVIHGDAHGWEAGDLAALPAALRELHPTATLPPVVIVDFLQLVSSEDAREELRQRIARAAYAARMAARKDNAIVILVSSTAREQYGSLDPDMAKAEKKADAEKKAKPPGEGNAARFMGLGKESGEIEYAADTVLVLATDRREQADMGRHPGGRLVWAALAATRAFPKGSKGWAALRFNGSRFVDSAGDNAAGTWGQIDSSEME